MISLFRKRPHLFILGLILLIGIFLRTYDLIDRAHLDHDSDLFSWIVKDIVVDHHFRLIGQLTSAPGIFIGPLFYYILIPFFLLFNMDPIAAGMPITIFGVLTLISYFLVFSKLFNNKVGLIATFLYSVLLPNIHFDRRVVPSTPANIWVIWYFFTILSISRGRYNYFFVLGILIGLIWHIHIALLPALLAIPVAVLVSRKRPPKKQLVYFFLSLFITSIPLLAFELRHNFSQTMSLVENFSSTHQGQSGIPKLFEVLNMISKNVNALFLSPQSLPEQFRPIFSLSLLAVTLFISLYKRLILKTDVYPLFFWFLGMIGFFTLTSSLISEYYFYNLEIIFTTFASLALYYIYRLSSLGKFLIISLLLLVSAKNLYFYTTSYIYHKGYVEKKSIVNFIKRDAVEKKFACIGISYITSPGENVGFRYLLYLSNIHIVHPSSNVPVYNIVIPDELSLQEVKIKFGHIGLIPPKNFSSSQLNQICQAENTNLTDSMFGFVK